MSSSRPNMPAILRFCSDLTILKIQNIRRRQLFPRNDIAGPLFSQPLQQLIAYMRSTSGLVLTWELVEHIDRAKFHRVRRDLAFWSVVMRQYSLGLWATGSDKPVLSLIQLLDDDRWRDRHQDSLNFWRTSINSGIFYIDVHRFSDNVPWQVVNKEQKVSTTEKKTFGDSLSYDK